MCTDYTPTWTVTLACRHSGHGNGNTGALLSVACKDVKPAQADELQEFVASHACMLMLKQMGAIGVCGVPPSPCDWSAHPRLVGQEQLAEQLQGLLSSSDLLTTR